MIGAGEDTTMKLSRTERLMLSNQYRILEALYPNERKSLEEKRVAVESGYELHYEWLAEHVYQDKDCMNEAQSREVLDILAMFDAIKIAYDHLQDKTGIEEHRVKFSG